MMTATATPSKTTRKARDKALDVCRLTITIRATSYALRPVPCPEGRAWRLRRSDMPADPIDVSATIDGASCTCGDFTFRRAGLDPAGCKHVRALVALGLLA